MPEVSDWPDRAYIGAIRLAVEGSTDAGATVHLIEEILVDSPEPEESDTDSVRLFVESYRRSAKKWKWRDSS